MNLQIINPNHKLDKMTLPGLWITILRLIFSAGSATAAGFQLLHFITWDPEKIARHGVMLDDAYFYSVLARSYQHLGFLTLDGSMKTNGIQPLWMFIQVLLGKVFANIDSALLLSYSSWTFYVLFSFLIIWHVSKPNSSSAILIFLRILIMDAAVVLNVHFQDLVVRGLEAPLMLFLLVLSLTLIDSVDHSTSGKGQKQEMAAWQTAVITISTVLVFFTRTDTFWLCLVTGLWIITTRENKLKNAIIYLCCTAIPVAPYVISNFISHGSIMPISGRVKIYYMNLFYPTLERYLSSSEWKGIFFTARDVFELPNELNILIFSSLAVIFAAFTFILIFRKSTALPASIKILSFTMIAHLLFMHFIYRELRPYSGYYFSGEIVWIFLVFCYSLDWPFAAVNDLALKRANLKFISPLAKGFTSLVLMLVILGMAGKYVGMHELKESQYDLQRVNLAMDLKNLVPEGGKIGAFWPGIFAQFSDRGVIPLDGIIGSGEYFRNYVQKGREIDYLFDNSSDYVIIFLKKFPDGKFSEKEPNIYDWTTLGTKRVWDYRHSLQIVSARTWGENKTGWYLIKISPGTGE